VLRVRAVGGALDPCGSLPDCGGRRLVHWMEEVVLSKQHARVHALQYSRANLARDSVRRGDTCISGGCFERRHG
jgi:hypothetical protein